MCLRLEYEYDCYEDPIKPTLQNVASWLHRGTKRRVTPPNNLNATRNKSNRLIQ
jgi:hypothetical protein